MILSIVLNKDVVKETPTKNYISSDKVSVALYDLEYNESISVNRGEEVNVYKFKEKREDDLYVKIKYNDEFYMIKENNLVKDNEEIIKEKELFVRTNLTVYKDSTSSKILSYIKKGERVEILGYDKIESGIVNKYKIKYNDITGYVYGKYLVSSKEESDMVYSENGIQEYMAKMGNSLGGGTATNLDFYPYEKANFENNKMPEEVRSLYINSGAVKKNR